MSEDSNAQREWWQGMTSEQREAYEDRAVRDKEEREMYGRVLTDDERKAIIEDVRSQGQGDSAPWGVFRAAAPVFYANTEFLPRELRGEHATGETCAHGRALEGEGCPACGAEAGESMPRADVRAVEPLTDDEVSEIVKGYVTAATWADLLNLPECPACGETLTETGDDTYRWTCEHDDCEQEGTSFVEDDFSSLETGSDPGEYGPDDLDSESLARIEAIVRDFTGMAAVKSDPNHWSRATLADVRLYEDLADRGGGFAHGRASVLEWLGHTLYLTASGHGVAFTDDEYPEPRSGDRADLTRERREWNGLLRRLQRASSGHGLDGIMLCDDGTIQVQG